MATILRDKGREFSERSWTNVLRSDFRRKHKFNTEVVLNLHGL